MSQSIVILGRQPAISLAELESVLGANKIQSINTAGAVLDIACQNVPFDRLGGVMKLGEYIGSTTVKQLPTYLINTIDQLNLPKQGKLNIGLSAYELDLRPTDINRIALTIKTKLKAKGQSARTVPNRDQALNTAQVWHNNLTKEHGLELLLLGQGNNVLMAKTTKVQDIKSYSLRDRSRPKRDTKIGMLPPKLAQIIINLASGNSKPDNNYLLDPFCGTGVILQEALLIGYNVLGSDIEPRMVEYSTTNLKWLTARHPNLKSKYKLKVADARSVSWAEAITAVASETYLGPALASLPSEAQLVAIISELNLLYKKFLQNLSKQLPSGTRLCLALPAWYFKGRFWHLSILDQLVKLGYNRLAFKHANFNQLIYHRPGQLVARELVVLIRK